MNIDDQLHSNVWRLLGAAAVLLLLSTVLGIGLISAGIFDPKPIGSLQRVMVLKPISLEPGAEEAFWQIEAIEQERASLRLRAAWRGGENDVGYGLSIGSKENYLVVGISPLGYATVQHRGTAISEEPGQALILPWQPWPHVRTDRLQNEIWVDIEHGFVTSVRINGEILLSGSFALPGEMVGMWLQSYGQGVEVLFEDLRLYHPE
jgi:hypothetical protein